LSTKKLVVKRIISIFNEEAGMGIYYTSALCGDEWLGVWGESPQAYED
jgi:hypothetical protein